MYGIGTAVPEHWFSQSDAVKRLNISDQRLAGIFLNSGIAGRYLDLPSVEDSWTASAESSGALVDRHRRTGVALAAEAIGKACLDAGVALESLDYVCCVTSTGFLVPGLSALLCASLDLRSDISRADIVGMGCNAGLNGLNSTVNWSECNPGSLGVLVCVEVCSAAYVFDNTIRTTVVNSLFGDGAAAAVVSTDLSPGSAYGEFQAFSSSIRTDSIDAMRFEWDEVAQRNSFFLDPSVPYVVGSAAQAVVSSILRKVSLTQGEIDSWVIHSGGKKVIDSVRVNLGLSPWDLRHTISILRDYGNLSSGSFLFSLERLIEEPGHCDESVMLITMGPGSTIESAILSDFASRGTKDE